MKTLNVILPIEFNTTGTNLNTIEPTWLVEMRLGGLKIQEFTYYGASEKQAIESAKAYLKEIC